MYVSKHYNKYRNYQNYSNNNLSFKNKKDKFNHLLPILSV